MIDVETQLRNASAHELRMHGGVTPYSALLLAGADQIASLKAQVAQQNETIERLRVIL